MSTLQEIEAAVDALSKAEQMALLHRIELKVRGDSSERGELVVENGRLALTAPAGAPVMTPDLVKAILADFP